jgi:hypothetical protein
MKSTIPHTNCTDPTIGELLVPYGLGTLNTEDATRFEDHLIECHFCQTELEAGFSALDILQRARPELVEELKSSGEDFESQLARLHGKTGREREFESMRGRWRRFWNAMVNPWVYGPVAATVAAILIIIQLDVRPPTQKLSAPPATQELSRIMPQGSEGTVPENSAVASPTDEAEKTAAAPVPHEDLAAKVPSSKPHAQADQQIVLKEETSEPKGGRELTARALRTDQTLSTEKIAEQNAPASTQTQTTVPEPVVVRGGRSSEMQVQVDGVDFNNPNAKLGNQLSTLQQRTSELLKMPPAYQDLSLESLLKKTPGFKVDPAGTLRVRDARKGANSPVGDAATIKEMNTAAAYHTGIEAYQKQDYPAAITALTETVQGNPRNSQAWFYLGISQLQMQKWPPAMQALTEADSLAGGRDPAARYYLSLASIKSGNLEKAKAFIGSLAERQDSLGIRAMELKQLLEQPVKPK